MDCQATAGAPCLDGTVVLRQELGGEPAECLSV